MSRRSRPQYRPGLEWILGVAFPDTLTRAVRLAQGFTFVRCCVSPRASSPHGLMAPALASRDGRCCVQLPPARGCYHLAPRRTFTSNPVPMPGTPGMTASPSFDRQRIDRRADRAGDRNGRRHEHELVDLVGGAIVGELLEIEDLAHGHAHDQIGRA